MKYLRSTALGCKDKEIRNRSLWQRINSFTKKKYQIDGAYKCLDFDALGAPFDWVISIEVGEHIPAEYMMIYIGIIFSDIKVIHNTYFFRGNRAFLLLSNI